MGTADFTNIEDLAAFCAVLVTKGIAFKVADCGGYYRVELTGF